MAESDRRHKYVYNRVLIDAGRILDPQFDDAVLFFTGAQIEMLRNMTQYLNRRDTYSSEEFLDYYLAPTVADFDDILAIVADMEETLMGNPNTIFGLADVLVDKTSDSSAEAPNDILHMNGPPEGEVWRIEGIFARNEDSTTDKILIRLGTGLGSWHVKEVDNLAANELVSWDGMLSLDDIMDVDIYFYGVTVGDTIVGGLRGYKMVVPT